MPFAPRAGLGIDPGRSAREMSNARAGPLSLASLSLNSDRGEFLVRAGARVLERSRIRR